MSILNQISQPIGKTIAKLINHHLVSIDTFRNIDFKGKLTISGYLDPSILPENNVYKCRGLSFYIDFNDEIQKDIYLDLFERVEAKILENYIKPGACCFDIGANIGFYSLHMAKAVGSSGKVFAFEPDPANLVQLDRNIALNGQENIVTTYPLGLSSETTTKLFSRTMDSNSGWGRIGEWDGSPEQLQIETITLDEFVSTNNIQKIDFLKCDIEGHEFEFIKGADRTLKSGTIDIILIEYCGYILERQGTSVQDYLDIFKGYNYTPFLLNLHQLENQAEFMTYNLMFAREPEKFS
jgi:FkbM family methyltransferase